MHSLKNTSIKNTVKILSNVLLDPLVLLDLCPRLFSYLGCV